MEREIIELLRMMKPPFNAQKVISWKLFIFWDKGSFCSSISDVVDFVDS